MKLAFFDTKPYDKPGFDEHIAGTDIEIKYFEISNNQENDEYSLRFPTFKSVRFDKDEISMY